ELVSLLYFRGGDAWASPPDSRFGSCSHFLSPWPWLAWHSRILMKRIQQVTLRRLRPHVALLHGTWQSWIPTSSTPIHTARRRRSFSIRSVAATSSTPKVRSASTIGGLSGRSPRRTVSKFAHFRQSKLRRDHPKRAIRKTASISAADL